MADGRLDLAGRLTALDEVVALAQDRLDDALVAEARAVTDTARERLARGAQAVVVALAGGTGSGKSSLFNTLAGAPLSRVGAVRPVTAEVTSWAVGDPAATTAVLDWLGVRRRHVAAAGPDAPEGLVLLDLPDHDSVAPDHRITVDRFVARVDVLVWVVDPLKYAQRALHDGYLRQLAQHARVVVVVLNRTDELDAGARRAVRDDLARLLAGAGLRKATLLATSARTGEGIAELRALIARFVRERRAVAERITADVCRVAAALREQVGDDRRVSLDADRLAAALATAAGVEALADAGARSYRDDANDTGRPLLTARVLRRFRQLRAPLRRLRTPLPTGVEVSPVAVRHAVLELVDTVARRLPHPWPARLAAAGRGLADELPLAVAKALDRVAVHDVRPRLWWRVFAVVGTAFEAATLVGVVWLCALGAVAWLQLPAPPTPRVGQVPWPTLLALGGALALLVTAALRRRLAAVGARRHRARVLRRLRAAVATAAEERALAPQRRELAAHDRLAPALADAGG